MAGNQGLMPNLIKKSWTVDVVYGRHLSQIMVSAPALAALMAALNPLGPPPTTKTEHLAKTGTCFGSSEIDKKNFVLCTPVKHLSKTLSLSYREPATHNLLLSLVLNICNNTLCNWKKNQCFTTKD